MSVEGFIFLCSKATEARCFELMLFGGKERYKSKTGKVTTGAKLFLYNYETKLLHGMFRAASDTKLNWVKNAWGKDVEYPWQVKIAVDKKYIPISRTDFENVVSFSASLSSRYTSFFPQARLEDWQVRELERIFIDPQRLPAEESDFRKEFPAELLTFDGHKVRSHAEVIIDDWLFHNNISHGYERKVPIDETMYCDFFLKLSNHADIIYVEYWGLEEEDYLKRKNHKLMLYEKYKFKLIELFPSDLSKIDEVLSTLKNNWHH